MIGVYSNCQSNFRIFIYDYFVGNEFANEPV